MYVEGSGDTGPVEYVPIVISSQTQTIKAAEDNSGIKLAKYESREMTRY